MNRRTLLATAGSAAVAALAGCTGGDGTAAETTTTTTGGAGTVTFVVVGPASDLVFEPAEVTIGVGGTMRWEWASNGHNVRPASQPEGADWSGTPGGDSKTYSKGNAYTHTFEVPGRYDYYCAPHRSLGMTGTVTVE